VSNTLLLMSLKHAGIDLKSVQIVPAGGIGANLSAVLSGALDAALTSEPVWTQERAKIKPVFWAKDELGPDMTQTVGVVTEDFGKSQPDKIRAIIAGRAKGVDYVYAHLEEAADITAKAYNMDPALVRTVFQHLKEMQWWHKGDLHYQAMDRMVEGMQVVGKLPGSIDWSKIVDTSFLPKDLQPKS
jgi:NitT/TauT family transport system substrate-binding protein